MAREKGDEVQRSICYTKIATYPSVRTELLGTGDALLLQHDDRATVRCAWRLVSRHCLSSFDTLAADLATGRLLPICHPAINELQRNCV